MQKIYYFREIILRKNKIIRKIEVKENYSYLSFRQEYLINQSL